VYAKLEAVVVQGGMSLGVGALQLHFLDRKAG
jgi:hypothetical protein